MSFKTKLKEIIDLLKQGHCTGTYAEDIDGNGCCSNSSKAVKWCLLGAMTKVSAPPEFRKEFRKALRVLFKNRLYKPEKLTVWNDDHKEEVIPTLERLYDEL